MLPDNRFINLIDLDLQKRIVNCDAIDKDATDALTLLLDQKPTMVKGQLDDWTMERFDDKTILFYKGKNYIPLE